MAVVGWDAAGCGDQAGREGTEGQGLTDKASSALASRVLLAPDLSPARSAPAQPGAAGAPSGGQGMIPAPLTYLPSPEPAEASA